MDGVESTVVTDHSPNTCFQTKADLSPRQVRWAERLSSFSNSRIYELGGLNVADPLSRHLLATAAIAGHVCLRFTIVQFACCCLQIG